MRLLILLALALAGAGLHSADAEAGKRTKAPAWKPAPVVKDCTRLNARFGYYGNPWCSQAEQEAFDRATTRRTR
jgi:hypothetical protein